MQTKMDPCFYKMSLYKVASVCKFGTNLNGVCVSNRCRWPGAHVVRYFFTIHSYLLLLLASPGADGGRCPVRTLGRRSKYQLSSELASS